MTLSQLRTFALVARLGSLHAAALALGISEPAVSAAIAALRKDLDDPLFVRTGSGISFTAGGRRLAARADEVVGLAEQIRREVGEAGTAVASLRVLASPAFEEHAAGALLDSFTRRTPGSRVQLDVRSGTGFAPSLIWRSADIALGPRPQAVADVVMDVVPFLRYQRIIVAAPAHPLARSGGRVPSAVLLAHPWLTGPGGIEEVAEEGRWLAQQDRQPDLVRLPSERDALASAVAGQGVMLAMAQVVREQLRSGTLVRLDVEGTPVTGLWCASTLALGRASAGARLLQRFVTTPEASAAMVAIPRPRRSRRAGSAVHVTLWSSPGAGAAFGSRAAPPPDRP
jgi:DNA-binding transcriptional LysR family regulator